MVEGPKNLPLQQEMIFASTGTKESKVPPEKIRRGPRRLRHPDQSPRLPTPPFQKLSKKDVHACKVDQRPFPANVLRGHRRQGGLRAHGEDPRGGRAAEVLRPAGDQADPEEAVDDEDEGLHRSDPGRLKTLSPCSGCVTRNPRPCRGFPTNRRWRTRRAASRSRSRARSIPQAVRGGRRRRPRQGPDQERRGEGQREDRDRRRQADGRGSRWSSAASE